jgi:hypothetical protein
MESHASGNGRQKNKGPDASPEKVRGPLYGDDVTAKAPAFVETVRMVYPGISAGEQFGQGFQVAYPIVALVRSLGYPWLRYGRDFNLVGRNLPALERMRPSQVRRQLLNQPVGGDRGYEAHHIVLQHSGCFGGGCVSAYLVGYFRISGFLGKPFVEAVDLPLAKPVTLIFELVVPDPCISKNVIQIDGWVEFFYVFHIVLDQPTIVERILDVTVKAFRGLHVTHSYKFLYCERPFPTKAPYFT